IRERVTIGGIDFIFHDTAGIRETSSGPERIGVEMTIKTLRESDLVLYVVDAGKGLRADEHRWLGLGRKTLTVMNKVDLADTTGTDDRIENTVWISAKYNTGIDRLTEVMAKMFSSDNPRVFIARHAYLLGKALMCLQQAREALSSGLTADVVSIELMHARDSLQEISGNYPDDDLLTTIFSQFCVGK
ncbi:MAG TPA: 50S ribosome-binding GTPase, partial [Deltaproteobacteria bacterium]|nr:50S ribosome-binding GTPase [Deltaproteobacteria bacterium]